VLHAAGDLRVEEWDKPLAGEGEVIVQVSYNGLCGTDATEYSKGPMMVPLVKPHPGSGHVGPTVLGHEFIGRVVEVGPGADSWLGRRVASGAGVSCGTCAWCHAGRTNLCASYYTLGLSTHGGLAEYAKVPTTTLVDVPDECSDVAAALAQPLAVGLHAVRRAGIRPGDRVVVLGAGAIGSFILAGLAGHSGPIAAIDVDETRLVGARALGATETHLVERAPNTDLLKETVMDPVDVVIESSGVPGAAASALGLVSRGGRVLLVGLVKVPQELMLADVVLREVDVATTVAHVCETDMPRALQLLRGNDALPAALNVSTIPLAEVVERGLQPLAEGTAQGKILVDPRNG
jgi:(R,R)-butanediol dehydrogenase/meso-butanediol dehydrogenase/diacetyl reductase